MSKSAAKASDTIEMSAFDTTKAADQLRAFAEQGVESSKEAYARMKSGAEEAQKALETTFETARSASSEVSLKTIGMMRSNAEAGFAHLEALVSVTSFSEFLELQGAFMRKRMETAVEQAKELQTVTTKAAEEMAKPVKSAVEKSMTELKVA